MLHRIFIAINLPESLKKKLRAFEDKWPQIPARWTKQENLHITLLFLGNLDDNQLTQTIKAIEEATKKHQPFFAILKHVCFDSDKKMPRMIWVEGEAENCLLSLQKNLEQAIFNLPSYQFKEKEDRPFKFHITLARIKQWQFKELEEMPEVNEDINFKFEVNTIEIMESQLKRQGPEYTILESFELGEI